METSIFTLAGKEQVSSRMSRGAATTRPREGLGRGSHDKVSVAGHGAAEGHPGSPLCCSILVLLGVSKDMPGTDPGSVTGVSIPSSASLTYILVHGHPAPMGRVSLD